MLVSEILKAEKVQSCRSVLEVLAPAPESKGEMGTLVLRRKTREQQRMIPAQNAKLQKIKKSSACLPQVKMNPLVLITPSFTSSVGTTYTASG